MPGRSTPSMTRTTITTPRYGSYHESKMSAFSGSSALPAGGGRRCTIASSTSWTPVPTLALASSAWSPSRPMMSVICRRASSGCAPGRSILLMTGNDLQAVVDREIGVRQRLRLDALRGVHQEERTLARRQRARHLVREVDVPRRVDQVQDIRLAIVRLVCQPDRMRLDRDPALALEIHRVEDLGFHLARLERARLFEEAVGQRRLAMIDVGDHGEVADETGVHVRTGARC